MWQDHSLVQTIVKVHFNENSNFNCRRRAKAAGQCVLSEVDFGGAAIANRKHGRPLTAADSKLKWSKLKILLRAKWFPSFILLHSVERRGLVTGSQRPRDRTRHDAMPGSRRRHSRKPAASLDKVILNKSKDSGIRILRSFQLRLALILIPLDNCLRQF